MEGDRRLHEKTTSYPFPIFHIHFFLFFSLFFLPPMLPKSIPVYVPSQSLNPVTQPVTPTSGLQPKSPCYVYIVEQHINARKLPLINPRVSSLNYTMYRGAPHFVSYLTHPRPVATAIKTTTVVPGWATPKVTAPILGATLTASIDLTTIPVIWWA